MAVKLVIAPEVEQDLSEAYSWYEGRRVGLGEEFLSCVDACIQAISRMPEKKCNGCSIIRISGNNIAVNMWRCRATK